MVEWKDNEFNLIFLFISIKIAPANQLLKDQISEMKKKKKIYLPCEWIERRVWCMWADFLMIE